MAQPTPLSQVPAPPPPPATPLPLPAAYVSSPNPVGGATITKLGGRQLAQRVVGEVVGILDQVAESEFTFGLGDIALKTFISLYAFAGLGFALVTSGMWLTSLAPDFCADTGGYLPTWLRQLLRQLPGFSTYGDPVGCSQVIASIQANWIGLVIPLVGILFVAFQVANIVIMKWLASGAPQKVRG